MSFFTHNNKSEYHPGGDLSFEYRLSLEAGLSYEVAKRIEFCACGYGAIVHYLIAQKFETPEDVDAYVEGINCLDESSSENTMNMLAVYLGL